MTADGARWAEALFPQHTKQQSGAAAVLKAADDMAARCQPGRDEAIFGELDAIERQDDWESS